MGDDRSCCPHVHRLSNVCFLCDCGSQKPSVKPDLLALADRSQFSLSGLVKHLDSLTVSELSAVVGQARTLEKLAEAALTLKDPYDQTEDL